MADHFERLGLPRRFSVDAAELERAYLDRSRAAHPDHRAADADQAGVLADAAAVNDAFAVLKDPLKRADHLLELLGGPPPGDRPADPAFLMDMMAARERLEAGDVQALDLELAERERAEFAAVEARFAANDLAAVRNTLDRLRTLASLRRDVRADLDE